MIPEGKKQISITLDLDVLKVLDENSKKIGLSRANYISLLLINTDVDFLISNKGSEKKQQN